MSWDGIAVLAVIWGELTAAEISCQLLLMLFFLLLNGFFVAAEFAIVKVRTGQLDEM
ncbi:MAG: hemolysin, partial [Verrucomicrobiota bacterium]